MGFRIFRRFGLGFQEIRDWYLRLRVCFVVELGHFTTFCLQDSCLLLVSSLFARICLRGGHQERRLGGLGLGLIASQSLGEHSELKYNMLLDLS